MTSSGLSTRSPSWSSSTKLVVSLTLAVCAVALLIQFRSIIGPLLLAFILTYLLHPVVDFIYKHTRLSWRMAVNLIYLVLILLLLGTFTATGFAVLQQLQALILVVKIFVNSLPQWIDQLSHLAYTFGPFQFDLGQLNLDLSILAKQALDILRPMLGKAGDLLGTLAGSAAGFLGWLLFIWIISYFLLAESSKLSDVLPFSEFAGYNYDIQRLERELGRTWQAFLRGQVTIILIVMVTSFTLMTFLGIRYALVIAILTGLARFVPYIGPLVTATVTALLAFFQGTNYFGLSPIYYAALVVGCAILLDQILDNLVSPRIFGQTLGVHPAAVLVVAVIAANLIGFTGIVLAAPVLATMKLLGRYVTRKMLDMNPWPTPEVTKWPATYPWVNWKQRLKNWINKISSQKR